MAHHIPRAEGLQKTRMAAAKAGENYFYTGRPCKYGHLAIRRTQSGECRQCNLEKQRKLSQDIRDLLKNNGEG